ncbi:hypothetical protein AQUCO_03000327v1 [Aquilegia coerulea]|uniref:ZF-HD dimerization-type domain-containing protein n=1 Tax=Aquilegia coerulea TaxID=218851 RepID=A0A2G5D2F8_AQUCA|nr:hypothetical protein AQUCO_03000327v1 [Aquilegia coerulea]
MEGGEGSFSEYYKECQKNHAAAVGLHATDGCNEYINDGTTNSSASSAALFCQACGCHPSFHNKVLVQNDSKKKKVGNIKLKNNEESWLRMEKKLSALKMLMMAEGGEGSLEVQVVDGNMYCKVTEVAMVLAEKSMTPAGCSDPEVARKKANDLSPESLQKPENGSPPAVINQDDVIVCKNNAEAYVVVHQ